MTMPEKKVTQSLKKNQRSKKNNLKKLSKLSKMSNQEKHKKAHGSAKKPESNQNKIKQILVRSRKVKNVYTLWLVGVKMASNENY